MVIGTLHVIISFKVSVVVVVVSTIRAAWCISTGACRRGVEEKEGNLQKWGSNLLQSGKKKKRGRKKNPPTKMDFVYARH